MEAWQTSDHIPLPSHQIRAATTYNKPPAGARELRAAKRRNRPPLARPDDAAHGADSYP